uniref:Ciliary neurotrophic factor n=1 Tax=Branchiostoma floridae TaxID=7739 RepID=C3YQM1_BRAFL|eukprot:XP_002601365.1 hypothetical protein BRAFLDRAFT_82711 [Branchiostoma floridae]
MTYSDEDTSLASLHRTLGTYNQAMSTVTGEARDLEAYNDPLRRSMEHTEVVLSNMLVKLQITLMHMRAEELDDVTVTEGPWTVDPEETTYERQLRHLTFFQHLCEILDALKQQLETRLADQC